MAGMKLPVLRLLAAAGLSLALLQCASEAPAGSARPSAIGAARRVSLPQDLSPDEDAAMPAVVSALKEAGFIPTRQPGSPYWLTFHLSSSTVTPALAGAPAVGTDATGRKQIALGGAGGLVRAAASLTLGKGTRTIATGHGVYEGPASLHSTEQTLHFAFDRCMDEFTAHLSRADELQTRREPTPSID